MDWLARMVVRDILASSPVVMPWKQHRSQNGYEKDWQLLRSQLPTLKFSSRRVLASQLLTVRQRKTLTVFYVPQIQLCIGPKKKDAIGSFSDRNEKRDTHQTSCLSHLPRLSNSLSLLSGVATRYSSSSKQDSFSFSLANCLSGHSYLIATALTCL